MSAPPRESGHDKQRSDHGIRTDSRGEDQLTDKKRAQQVDGGDAQREDARQRPQGPGQPAGGE
jgi:hypothetical protein